jgi:hypothetical protein
VNTVINLRLPQKMGKFFKGSVTLSVIWLCPLDLNFFLWKYYKRMEFLKTIVAQKFATFYRTKRSTAMFTRFCH